MNSLHPPQPHALLALGTALAVQKRHDQAVACFSKALDLQPERVDIYLHRSASLVALGRLEEALAGYDRAMALDPGNAATEYNRGHVLHALKRNEEALESFSRFVAVNPDHANAYCNQGMVLHDLRRYGEALASFDRSIALKPDGAMAHYNRGILLAHLRQHDEALAAFDRAFASDPEFFTARWAKSLQLILAGDYAEGWRLYEWRWKNDEVRTGRTPSSLSQPAWLGDESIGGKTLFIYHEQGFGDFIQFCRYVPLVVEAGAKVILEVPEPLHSLASTLEGEIQVLEPGAPLPGFDYHCPIMSLPLAFRTTVDTIPARIPYLRPDPARRSQWRARLGGHDRLRVGLAWSGASTHRNDRNRSIPLSVLAPLTELPVEFHCLQREIRDSDLEALGRFNRLVDRRELLRDFADTAALIMEMDLVISADTSVAHLAGALGQNVWVLLPYAPDFRWMLEGRASPWYPSMTLFRQPVIDDWKSVVSEVAGGLNDLLAVKEL